VEDTQPTLSAEAPNRIAADGDTLAGAAQVKCDLSILFLRQEPPGRIIYQGGDLDNRLKTLFDALCVPPHQNQLLEHEQLPQPDPINCLLEDDSLIASVNIETQQLLSRPGAPANEVRLVIQVVVRVTQARLYNQPFLGD
jgi:hypothetical protein